MAAARRLNQIFLLGVLCFSLMSCSVIRPALITDAKERICKRSRDIKDVEAAKIVHRTQQSVIEGCNWEFDNNGRVFLVLQARIAAEGDYDIALDFHEPFADFLFHSSLGFLSAGGKENIRIGPLPYEFSGPSFVEVSLLLLKKDDRGEAVLVDEADTYFLLDTDFVNDAALSGFDTGGLTAQTLLDKYAPLLKTDIVTNSKTRVVFFDLPPKNVAAVLSGPPEEGGKEQAMIKCDLWNDQQQAKLPIYENRKELNGRKDDYFIDLPQPFASIAHPWREIINRYPNAIYGRVVRTRLVWEGVERRDALVLQYWMPYYVNHLSILKTDLQGKSWLWNAGNYHEGESENISVVLIPGKDGLEPLCAAFAKHFKGTAEPWANVRKHAPDGIPTSHPVIYVANGSHASFFSPDVDEATCGSGIDAGMHGGGGFWYGEETLGKVRMMPRLNEIKFGDEYDFLLFTGRFGGSYIEGAVNKFNRSPYMFPYTFYPKFSVTGSWIAGSGVNRWIDPAGEIHYQAKIPSKLKYNNRGARFYFDTSRIRVTKEAERICIENLGFVFEGNKSSPAAMVAVFFRDRTGQLRKLTAFDIGGTLPSAIYIPKNALREEKVELVACDLVVPSLSKFPLERGCRAGMFEYFLITATKLKIP